MIRISCVAVAAVITAMAAAPADAHRTSDAFVTLNVQGATLTGSWEIALRDLDVAEDLDGDRDGKLTWGELHASRDRITEDLQRRFSVTADAQPCELDLGELLVNDRVDGRFAWFALRATCQHPPRELNLSYRFLFDQDPSHRGILVLSAATSTHTAVFAPAQGSARIDLEQASPGTSLIAFVREGIHHIWIGADHVLFLASLLLPCVLVRSARGWRGVERLPTALWDIAGIVTAFTAAHSITLSLAALDIVALPARLTESAIAASVILAALNNLRPIVLRARWTAAFGFGLVHGFGFASVLGELGLPAHDRILSLVAFNLGVELGQLAIVTATLPLAYGLRNTWGYQRVVFSAGSLAIAAVGSFWLYQRTAGA